MNLENNHQIIYSPTSLSCLITAKCVISIIHCELTWTYECVKGLLSELKQPPPRSRRQRVSAAWHPPGSLPVLPAEPQCLSPPAPPLPSLLRVPKLPLSAREHHPLSRNGYPRAVGLLLRPALSLAACSVCVLRARRAAPLPASDGPNAGWRRERGLLQAVGGQSSVTVLLNSTRRPREAGLCRGSAAPSKRAGYRQTVTQRTASSSLRPARRTAPPDPWTGCQCWARR